MTNSTERLITIPHAAGYTCGSGCIQNGTEDVFVLDGRKTRVIVPACSAYLAGTVGRVASIVAALERHGLYELIHERFAFERWRLRCSLPPDFIERRRHPIHDLAPAYRSSYTAYYLASDIEALIEAHVQKCAECGALRAEDDEDAIRGSFVSGWVSGFSKKSFCSGLCERNYYLNAYNSRQRTRRQIEWLRKGKRLLVENRKLLRQPPSPSASHHGACSSPPTA